MLNTITNERTSILRMVDEQKITPDQGVQLLEALDKDPSQKSTPRPLSGGGEGHCFRVLVTDTVTGRTKTSVTIPLGLVRWGLKVGAHYGGNTDKIDLDELADLIASGAQGQIIDVMDEEDGEHVQIFVE